MNRSLEKFNKLVEALEQLPTIGKKSATRLAYHMVTKDSFGALRLSHAIEDAISAIKRCQKCGAMSEDELCPICCDERRDARLLCIVESAKDILLLEENGLFDGKYFVLESLDEINVNALIERVEEDGVEEIIFALTPSIQNDAVILYIEDKFADYELKFTKIAQGVPTGVSLENIDILSLSRALEDRVRI
ncbi:Recombination protein RecR [hydrothermal vent metagenome]|uniref:Recombination protein RecR n=1 Tax=hydrothermal vent metagenome TaxID=652676 RepID=A0A1W1B9L4_9ZZZZ